MQLGHQEHPYSEIFCGYLLAGLTLCVGFYLALSVESSPLDGFDAGTIYLRGFYGLAVAITFICTAWWGKRRGFPIIAEGGAIRFGNLLRSVVMTAIVWFLIGMVFAPVLIQTARLGR